MLSEGSMRSSFRGAPPPSVQPRPSSRRSIASGGGMAAMARRSAAAGEWESAIDWWRRGIDANPLDPQAALGLLEALIESGDRPAAIRYAREYEERLRSELEVAPDPAFTSLVDRTR